MTQPNEIEKAEAVLREIRQDGGDLDWYRRYGRSVAVILDALAAERKRSDELERQLRMTAPESTPSASTERAKAIARDVARRCADLYNDFPGDVADEKAVPIILEAAAAIQRGDGQSEARDIIQSFLNAWSGGAGAAQLYQVVARADKYIKSLESVASTADQANGRKNQRSSPAPVSTPPAAEPCAKPAAKPNETSGATPRSNAESESAFVNGEAMQIVPLEFAQCLERELAEQIKSHGQTVGVISDALRERDEAKALVNQLQNYLAAANISLDGYRSELAAVRKSAGAGPKENQL